tara:strand:+ start:244 stop:375 length:132 start_codon:yes stop_codon:yes gene_type:complete
LEEEVVEEEEDKEEEEEAREGRACTRVSRRAKTKETTRRTSSR